MVKFLNLQDCTSIYDYDKVMSKMESLLDRAIKLAPNNQVAILNRTLLQWHTGQLVDQELQYQIQTTIQKLDPELSKLMFILYKENINSGHVCEHSKKEWVAPL